MTAIALTLVCGAVFLASAAIAELVRHYALRSGLLDVPGSRSSHQIPTPRGGGLGAVVAFIAAAAILPMVGAPALPAHQLAALLGGMAAVALIGWIDDHRSLSPLPRILVHAAAAVSLVVALGVPAARGGVLSVAIGIVAVVAVVWVVNLYNFMDGIDALAAGQAVVVAAGGALVAASHGDTALATGYVLLSAAAAGLLVRNRPPARLFMGDVGSGALGFVLAGLGLAGAVRDSVPLEAWLLLMAVFIVDATATLLRRAVGREPWYRPHRTHAYQRAVQRGWSHGQVALTVFAINVTLVAIALVMGEGGGATTALVGVYALLLVAWWRLAGPNRARAAE